MSKALVNKEFLNTPDSSEIGFLPAGTGAVTTTVQGKLRESVSVKDFGAVGDGVADDTAAIQAACNYASSNGRKTVFIPAGSYKVSSTIYTRDVTTTNGATACGFEGEGPFSTRFMPSSDFTVINALASYQPCGGFSIEWSTTAIGSIPATRIGVELCDGYNQVSQTRVHDILVTYAYNSFLQRDWTASPGGLGTMYVVDFERLISFRAADYGFKFTAVNGGSTTHRFSTCWANCSNSIGAAGGKGFSLSGINDIQLENCAVDQCADSAFLFINGYQINAIATALESCSSVTNGVPLIQVNGAPLANFVGIKEIAGTVNIPAGQAYGIFAGANCICNVKGYTRSALTTTAGTLYKIGLNANSTRINADQSIAFSEAQDNGWFSMIAWNGVRYSSTGTIPSQGTNQRGEYVRNMLPAVGSPKGWYCTVAGTSGTWVSEGNL